MRRTLFAAFMLAMVSVAALGQETTDTVTLGEVVVKGARVVRRVDGKTLYPTEIEKKHSHSGYSLLNKLALPDIRIDEMSRSVQSISNRGDVQVRINDIVANANDMQAIDVATITSVDYIDNPGVRYGNGIAYVINIRTRRSTMGYSVGAQAMNVLTALSGFNNVFASVNNGKSQFRVFYEQGYRDTKGSLTDETANYLLADGTQYNINRNMLDNRTRAYDNSIELRYNLADSANYVFQATLSAALSNSPRTFSHRLITETGKANYTATESNRERSSTPVLDIYYHRQLGKHQTITANTVGTYIHTLDNNYYDEGGAYAYDVDGNSYSLIGEAIYENRLKPFTLSAGLNTNWKYINNIYRGDVASTNGIHRVGVYAYAQINGTLGKLGYMTGMGASYEHYRQGDNEYGYWLWRPKMQLSYHLSAGIQLAYSIELSQHISNIAMISDTRIRQNSMEWKVGNPELKPNSRLENNLTVSYNRTGFYTQLSAMYRINRNCNMEKYTRTDDNQYLYSSVNQGHCNMLYMNSYSSVNIIADHLTITFSGTMARFFNKGDDYNHCYTSFSAMGNVTGYFGKWTVQLSADSGWRFMEAEMKGYNAGTVMGSVGYHIGNCDITAYVVNPFQRNPLKYRSTIVNQWVNKRTSLHSKDAGNSVQLSVVWRLNCGKKYRETERKINNKDKETGIM